MKFAYAGPFASRKTVPVRPSLAPVSKADFYTPDSPESYAVWTQLDPDLLTALEVVLFSEPKPRRRRGGRRAAARNSG
jgi:hypothetical protein